MDIKQTGLPAQTGARLEKYARWILSILFFILPIFILPFSIAPLALSKALLLYIGVGVAGFLWLIARLQRGSFVIPKSSLLFAFLGAVIVWFVSAILSDNISLSLSGTGHEIGTFAFVSFLSIAALLISVLFSDEEKILSIYKIIGASALIVLIVQILHVAFGISTVIPFVAQSSIGVSSTNNLIGGWNDFGIFFGFIALSALAFFEFRSIFNVSRLIRAILFVAVVVSIITMMTVNFRITWIILGASILVLLIHLIAQSLFNARKKLAEAETLIRPTLFILLAILFFILAHGALNELPARLGTTSIEARPSWSATQSIIKDSLKDNLLLGSGPATFLYDWLQNRPESVNNTRFWNVRFESGIGHLPSMVATTGVLGAVALLAILIAFLRYGIRVLSSTKHDKTNALLVISFIGALYLWSTTVFYAPGFFVFALAFLVTGMFLALLVRARIVSAPEIVFVKNPRIGFTSILVVVLLLIASVSSMYIFGQKAVAAYSYTRGITSLNERNDLDAAEQNLTRAFQIGQKDIYARALSELMILRVNQLVARRDISPEEAQTQFQNLLGNAIKHAQQATQLNGADPLNWMQLGRVYEAVVPLRVDGASERALESYSKALTVSPTDPTPYLSSARVEMQIGDTKSARDFIDKALLLKHDFARALLLLSQIESKDGNIKSAIDRTAQAAIIAPNDVGVLFQLGVLYYRDGQISNARRAFERTVSLNNNYANARYFLGLIYEKQGDNQSAMKQFEWLKKNNPNNQEVQDILDNLKKSE